MNYSHQIGYQPGFWPLAAMSPYTAPWAHYVGAIFLRLFAPTVLVFRLSQVILAFVGMGFIFVLLWQRVSRVTAFHYLLAVMLLPGLVLNHRFAVELNGFHVFCFGGLLWSLASRRAGSAAVFFLMGATSHILFYSLGLGLVAAIIWEK